MLLYAHFLQNHYIPKKTFFQLPSALALTAAAVAEDRALVSMQHNSIETVQHAGKGRRIREREVKPNLTRGLASPEAAKKEAKYDEVEKRRYRAQIDRRTDRS